MFFQFFEYLPIFLFIAAAINIVLVIKCLQQNRPMRAELIATNIWIALTYLLYLLFGDWFQALETDFQWMIIIPYILLSYGLLYWLEDRFRK